MPVRKPLKSFLGTPIFRQLRKKRRRLRENGKTSVLSCHDTFRNVFQRLVDVVFCLNDDVALRGKIVKRGKRVLLTQGQLPGGVRCRIATTFAFTQATFNFRERSPTLQKQHGNLLSLGECQKRLAIRWSFTGGINDDPPSRTKFLFRLSEESGIRLLAELLAIEATAIGGVHVDSRQYTGQAFAGAVPLKRAFPA